MKLRWVIALPVGHLAVDCIILLSWLSLVSALPRHKADVASRRGADVLLMQETASVTFDPRYFPPPAEFLLLASGTLPALLISGEIRPQAYVITPGKLWDPSWFLIHESVSLLVWLCIGAFMDWNWLRIRKVLIAYLAIRFGFAALFAIDGAANMGWRLNTFFWLGFAVYAAVRFTAWSFSRIRSRATAT